MTERLQLDLPVLLPEVKDTRDMCVERLIATLEGAREIEDVHVDVDDAHPVDQRDSACTTTRS